MKVISEEDTWCEHMQSVLCVPDLLRRLAINLSLPVSWNHISQEGATSLFFESPISDTELSFQTFFLESVRLFLKYQMLAFCHEIVCYQRRQSQFHGGCAALMKGQGWLWGQAKAKPAF